MVIFIFLKFGTVKLFETLQTVSKGKMNIFHEITILLFITYSFIEFKILISVPKSFHGDLDHENVLQLANWPCYWSQFNWVKQTDNTASVQWGFTVDISLSEHMEKTLAADRSKTTRCNIGPKCLFSEDGVDQQKSCIAPWSDIWFIQISSLKSE